MTDTPDRYFVQTGDSSPWIEVTKADYVDAERGAGFHNTMGQPDEPATGGFGGRGISGSLCYGGRNLPDTFISLEEQRMAQQPRPKTPDEFHADLVKQFNIHCEHARKGLVEPFSFMQEEGLNYNGWVEHRHGWPVTDDYLCGPLLASTDLDEAYGLEVPFEECDTCSRLVDMYRDYVSKYRIERSKERRENAKRFEFEK